MKKPESAAARTLSSSGRVAMTLVALALVAAPLLTGCGRLPDGSTWADEATVAPGWGAVRSAAGDAAREPETWVPAVAAVLVGLLGDDANLSGWATDHTPVFGSTGRAAAASDALAAAAYATWVATSVAAPGGERPGRWCVDKLRGFGVEGVAVAATEGATLLVKRATRRTRPDESNRQSFPSAHTSSSAVCTTLSLRNASCYAAAPWAGVTTRLGADALVAATGWARIEAGKHYLSDVLAGAALGHFIGAFVHDAFLRPGGLRGVSAVVQPSRDGTTGAVYWRF